MLNKRDRIISKTQQYWVKIYKYGIRIPKTVKEAVEIDQYNGDTFWWDSIMQ